MMPSKSRRVAVEDPPIARFLFGSTAVAWVWLIVRVWVGYTWLASSLRKVADPNWVHLAAYPDLTAPQGLSYTDRARRTNPGKE